MADMHRPGRIGGDVFDIDLVLVAALASPVVHTGADRRGQRLAPHRRIERQVDEARPRDLGLGDLRPLLQLGCDLFREIARLEAGVLGQHHRRVGGEVAVARLARRLDHDAVERGRGSEHAGLGQRLDGIADVGGEEFENVHAAR